MKESLLTKSQYLKNKIELENKNNPNKKRVFSESLKKEILNFVDSHNLGPYQMHKTLGVHSSSIKNWRKIITLNTGFKEISIAPYENEGRKIPEEIYKTLKFNQTVLIALLILLLAEKLFYYLT